MESDTNMELALDPIGHSPGSGRGDRDNPQFVNR